MAAEYQTLSNYPIALAQDTSTPSPSSITRSNSSETAEYHLIPNDSATLGQDTPAPSTSSLATSNTISRELQDEEQIEADVSDADSTIDSSTRTASIPEGGMLPTLNGAQKDSDTEVAGVRTLQPAVNMRSTLKSWTLEVIAIIMSIGSTVAVVILLLEHQDRRIDRWSLAVSLNTVVSTLGTLSRITLAFALSASVGQQKWSWLRKRPDHIESFIRFDEAAKGPWGGSRLFFWLRARHWAAIGAVAIMGAVAFDPFLQAVISHQGRLENMISDSPTAIAMARSIHSGVFEVQDGESVAVYSTPAGDLRVLPVNNRPDFGLIGSIYSGLRNSTKSWTEPVGFNCASGNCTWPIFASAAICSSCVDISSHLQSAAEYTDEDSGTSVGGGGTSYMFLDSVESITWSVPSGSIKNWNSSDDSVNEAGPTLMTLNTSTRAAHTTGFTDRDTLLMAFTIIKATAEEKDKRTSWGAAKPVATECALFLCANAFEAASTNNELAERVVGSWSLKKPDSYLADPDLYNDHTDYDMDLASAVVLDIGQTLYDKVVIREDLRLEIPMDSTKALGLVDREFNVSQGSIYNIIFALEKLVYEGQSKKIPIGYTTMAMKNSKQPMIVDALWNSTNLSSTFEKLARSMTLELRNTSPDKHYGTMQEWAIHIQVHWWYLTFPVTMLTLGLVYVILVIVESTQLRIPVWKENARPTLLYGFDDETQRLLREEDMKKLKKRTRIRYGRDDKEGCLRLGVA